MRYFIYIFVFLITAVVTVAQNIERKIVIENNQFYYTSIDEEFQIATLHTGKISESLKSARLLALPAGRNYAEPVNPFSWDLHNDNFYCVNFILHPLNDRNEALKRFPVSTLKTWSNEVNVMDMLMKSVDRNMFAPNNPYQYIVSKSNIFNCFFYDGIALNDSSYFVAICNNNLISIWNYNGKKWEHGSDMEFPYCNYFSLFIHNENLYLISGEGNIFSVKDYSMALVNDKSVGDALSDCVIIENRDDNSISVMKNNNIDFNRALDEQIINKAIKIF
ncbi:MAG: hypothetical protein PHD97_01570 [Bacteroidales bacterium]|nr:hypothetical protein [Bacteroidales bacterium]